MTRGTAASVLTWELKAREPVDRKLPKTSNNDAAIYLNHRERGSNSHCLETGKGRGESPGEKNKKQVQTYAPAKQTGERRGKTRGGDRVKQGIPLAVKHFPAGAGGPFKKPSATKKF